MSQWIKCSDRLPLEPCAEVTYEQIEVLAANRNGDVAQMMFARGGGHINLPWAAWDNYGAISRGEITHWMPMPDAPE